MKDTHRHHERWELSLGPEYDRYTAQGYGSKVQWTFQFVVSPRLPDGLKNITCKFSRKFMNFGKGTEDAAAEVIIE